MLADFPNSVTARVKTQLSVKNTVQSQSISQNEKETLEKQIQQLFLEVVSVWRETDLKKIVAVKHLAARMEEYYISQNTPEMVRTISASITQRLQQLGIATAHHVSDYLDEQYKQTEFNRSSPHNGTDVDNNSLEESARANPFDVPAEGKRVVLKNIKKRMSADEALSKAIESAAKIQKQALDYETDTFTHTTRLGHEHVHTVNPKKHYRGPVHEAMSLLVEDLGKYYYDMKETLDDVEDWYRPQTTTRKTLCQND